MIAVPGKERQVVSVMFVSLLSAVTTDLTGPQVEYWRVLESTGEYWRVPEWLRSSDTGDTVVKTVWTAVQPTTPSQHSHLGGSD